MAIRYDSQLKSEIRKTVKSFNAKIRRLESKGVSAALLPNKVSSKEIQAGMQSRRDLRKRLQQLGEFSSAGVVEESQGGLLGTNTLFQYRQGEANRAIQGINKEYDKLINTQSAAPMMQGEYAANLRAKMNYLARDVRSLDIKQINIFNKNILTPEQKYAKDEQFYQNFNRMLFYDAYAAGLPPALIREISEKLEKFTPQQLLELYRTEPSFKAVTDVYMRSKQSQQFEAEAEIEEQFKALLERIDEKLS